MLRLLQLDAAAAPAVMLARVDEPPRGRAGPGDFSGESVNDN